MLGVSYELRFPSYREFHSTFSAMSNSSTGSNNGSKLDESIMNGAIPTGLNGVSIVVNSYLKGTQEVKNLLINECNVIVECKICLQLFRSIPQFLVHKRSYCRNSAICQLRHQFLSDDAESAPISKQQTESTLERPSSTESCPNLTSESNGASKNDSITKPAKITNHENRSNTLATRNTFNFLARLTKRVDAAIALENSKNANNDSSSPTIAMHSLPTIEKIVPLTMFENGVQVVKSPWILEKIPYKDSGTTNDDGFQNEDSTMTMVIPQDASRMHSMALRTRRLPDPSVAVKEISRREQEIYDRMASKCAQNCDLSTSQCLICKKTFKHLDTLAFHLTTAHNDQSRVSNILCLLCGVDYPDIDVHVMEGHKSIAAKYEEEIVVVKKKSTANNSNVETTDSGVPNVATEMDDIRNSDTVANAPAVSTGDHSNSNQTVQDSVSILTIAKSTSASVKDAGKKKPSVARRSKSSGAEIGSQEDRSQQKSPRASTAPTPPKEAKSSSRSSRKRIPTKSSSNLDKSDETLKAALDDSNPSQTEAAAVEEDRFAHIKIENTAPVKIAAIFRRPIKNSLHAIRSTATIRSSTRTKTNSKEGNNASTPSKGKPTAIPVVTAENADAEEITSPKSSTAASKRKRRPDKAEVNEKCEADQQNESTVVINLDAAEPFGHEESRPASAASNEILPAPRRGMRKRTAKSPYDISEYADTWPKGRRGVAVKNANVKLSHKDKAMLRQLSSKNSALKNALKTARRKAEDSETPTVVEKPMQRIKDKINGFVKKMEAYEPPRCFNTETDKMMMKIQRECKKHCPHQTHVDQFRNELVCQLNRNLGIPRLAAFQAWDELWNQDNDSSESDDEKNSQPPDISSNGLEKPVLRNQDQESAIVKKAPAKNPKPTTKRTVSSLDKKAESTSKSAETIIPKKRTGSLDKKESTSSSAETIIPKMKPEQFVPAEFTEEQKAAIDEIMDRTTNACLKCGIDFSTSSNAVRHCIAHLGYVRYKCIFCNTTSFHRGDLRRHLRCDCPKYAKDHKSTTAKTPVGESDPNMDSTLDEFIVPINPDKPGSVVVRENFQDSNRPKVIRNEVKKKRKDGKNSKESSKDHPNSPPRKKPRMVSPDSTSEMIAPSSESIVSSEPANCSSTDDRHGNSSQALDAKEAGEEKLKKLVQTMHSLANKPVVIQVGELRYTTNGRLIVCPAAMATCLDQKNIGK